MSTWTLATELAIWTLIAGSLAVFAWFLVEVWRLMRSEGRDAEGDDARGGRGP
jgi:hypothetical protein